MKFPLSWLKNTINIEIPPHQIAKLLTSAGIEVESVDKMAAGFSKVVVAKILEVSPHPNADKLCLAKVSDGVTSFEVICGAPNCRVGIKTALAPIGATLIDDEGKEFKVKKAKIRGVESFGMLCSGKELGISEDGEGILEFADYLAEGADVGEIYADTLFEVSLTPNLSHAASLLGIARELGALTFKKVESPLIYVDEKGPSIEDEIQVKIVNSADCPRYSCRVIDNVKIAPSPDWLKKRLQAAGIRPVNNIVDITNYVFLELGQPLHAFDYDKLTGKQIIVRNAKEGEKIVTLDGRERLLTEKMLVIADEKTPVAIAGVMGGINSEVTDSTTKVVLESAYFNSSNIRKTSKELQLITDASRHFERKTDPNGVLRALDRAAMLVAEIAGGKVARGVIDIKESNFPENVVPCRLSKINALLGTHLGIGEVEEIFQRLSLMPRWDGKDTFQVTVPTFRTDILQEVDLIEEVARIFGYENIPRHSAIHHASAIQDAPIYLYEREVRRRLIAEGLQEFLTCDLIGPSLLEIAPNPSMAEDSQVKVINPTSIEQSILRTSLFPGLLQVVKYNFDHDVQDISGFEVGRIHFKKGDQYKEQSVAAIVLAGRSSPYHIEPKPHIVDFYDIKGIIENLLKGLNLRRFSFRASSLPIFHSGRQTLINVDSKDVGVIGEVHPSIQRKLDVPMRILFAEIDLHELYKSSRQDLKMQPIPVYPASERDWNMNVKEQTPIMQIIGSIRRIPSNLLEEVSLKDIFQSEKIGEGVKVVTLHFVYRDKEKTVSKSEVDAEHERITATARHMLEAYQVKA